MCRGPGVGPHHGGLLSTHVTPNPTPPNGWPQLIGTVMHLADGASGGAVDVAAGAVDPDTGVDRWVSRRVIDTSAVDVRPIFRVSEQVVDVRLERRAASALTQVVIAPRRDTQKIRPAVVLRLHRATQSALTAPGLSANPRSSRRPPAIPHVGEDFGLGAICAGSRVCFLHSGISSPCIIESLLPNALIHNASDGISIHRAGCTRQSVGRQNSPNV
jgi:hypothetical protein